MLESRSAWPPDFPDVIAHGVHGIKNEPGWALAKVGDGAAALQLVGRIARREAAEQLRTALKGRDALLLPVRQLEQTAENRIPGSFAAWLAARLDLAVAGDIVRVNRTMRTSASALQRLVRRAAYDGKVEVGRAYVIVDDVVTQGGTVADLRGYIEGRGGRVLAVTALQAPGANARLRLADGRVAELRDRLGDGAEAWWRERFGHGWDGLTDSEARQLLRFGSGAELRDRLGLAFRAERSGSVDPG